MATVSSHTLNSVDGTHAGGIAVTLFRVNDLVVVHSGGHTFVTTREDASEMKRIFEGREDDGNETADRRQG